MPWWQIARKLLFWVSNSRPTPPYMNWEVWSPKSWMFICGPKLVQNPVLSIYIIHCNLTSQVLQELLDCFVFWRYQRRHKVATFSNPFLEILWCINCTCHKKLDWQNWCQILLSEIETPTWPYCWKIQGVEKFGAFSVRSPWYRVSLRF